MPTVLSAVDLMQLTPLHLRQWLLCVAEEHPRAAQLDRIMLHRALTIAAKCGLCRPGLTDPDVLPPIEHEAQKIVTLSLEQLRRYMVAAAEQPTGVVLLLCCCGLRRCEAMGVRWCDLEGPVLHVRVQRKDHDPLPLKSASSARSIALPGNVLRAIMQQPRVSPWVCAASMTAVYRDHRRVLRELSLPGVTLHGLRHSVATAAALAGEPMKLIQATLGHSNYKITADLYADHLPSATTVMQRVHDWKSCVG